MVCRKLMKWLPGHVNWHSYKDFKKSQICFLQVSNFLFWGEAVEGGPGNEWGYNSGGGTRKVRQDRMMCEVMLEIPPDSFRSYKGALILILAKHPTTVWQAFIYYHSQIGLMLWAGHSVGSQSSAHHHQMVLVRSLRKGAGSRRDPPKNIPFLSDWRGTCLLLLGNSLILYRKGQVFMSDTRERKK